MADGIFQIVPLNIFKDAGRLRRQTARGANHATRLLKTVLSVAVGTAFLVAPIKPAHAGGTCSGDANVPYVDTKLFLVTASSAVNCTNQQRVVTLQVEAQKDMTEQGRGWETRTTSSRSWNDAHGGFWSADASCAGGNGPWRSKGFHSTLEPYSSDSSFFYNHQGTSYSGTKWAQCNNGGIPVIDEW